LDDDTDAQERIIKHLLLPYVKGNFHPSYLHEHAGGRLSAFLKSDLLKIRPTFNSSSWRRGAAHLINASVKEDASIFFTEEFPNFIQCAGSVDGASVCAKLVSMIHDQPLESEDPTIICQIDFANAFQTPNRQLGTNDCILGIASRTYGIFLRDWRYLSTFFAAAMCGSPVLVMYRARTDTIQLISGIVPV
jgi:hypothetical protein